MSVRNPAVWWLVSRIRRSREEVVDELTVLATHHRRAYLEALLADPVRGRMVLYAETTNIRIKGLRNIAEAFGDGDAGIAEVENRDLGTHANEFFDGGETETGGSAGDDGDTVGNLHGGLLHEGWAVKG